MNTFPRLFVRAVALVAAFTLLTTTAAFADVPVTDIDGDLPFTEFATLNLPAGTCVGSTEDVLVAVKRQDAATDGLRTFNNNALVTFSATPQTAGSGLATSFPSGNQVTLPSNWTSLTTGVSDARTLRITFNSAATYTSTNGTIVVVASGLSVSNVVRTRSVQLKVVGTVSNCDTTPPTITPTITGTLGDNGWYVSNVTVSWSVVDNESAVSSTSGCGSTSITADTAGVTLTCMATSLGGTSSQSVTIKRDATAPTLSPSVSPNPVVLNGTATASPNAADTMSGLASSSCGAVDTSSVGSKTVACTAIDNAGNSAGANASYSVVYNFTGFFSPVDNPPALNKAKAGQAIPLKWRLTDANGAPVTNLSSIVLTVDGLTCSLGTTTDEVEEYTTGSSGLQNLGDGYYQFNWATPKSYAGSCKTAKLNLGEGSTHNALFQFTR